MPASLADSQASEGYEMRSRIFAACPIAEETVAVTRAGTEKMVVGSVLGGWGGERRPHIVNTEVLST